MPIAIAAKSRQIILFVARVKSLLPETLSINILKKRKYLMILADSILNLWRFFKWERRLPEVGNQWQQVKKKLKRGNTLLEGVLVLATFQSKLRWTECCSRQLLKAWSIQFSTEMLVECLISWIALKAPHMWNGLASTLATFFCDFRHVYDLGFHFTKTVFHHWGRITAARRSFPGRWADIQRNGSTPWYYTIL